MRSLFFTALTTLASLAAISCSSSESSAPATADSGTGADTGTTSDAPAGEAGLDPSGLPKCGNAPWVVVQGLIQIQDPAGIKPAAGAKMTASCSSESITLGADGRYAIAMQKDLVAHVKLEAMGAITAILGDFKVTTDSVINLTMLPAIFKAFIDGWKDGEPAVFILVDPKAMTGVCSTKDGVSLTLKDQPNASVKYFAEGTLPQIDPAATMSTKAGYIAVTGATGTHVEFTATKAGCTVGLPVVFTGKLRLEPNVINESKVNVNNPI